MKSLLLQIKSFGFCKKVDQQVKMLIAFENKAKKEFEEISRVSYLNYLKLKEKGLLTKEYFEQQYKTLEDIIFERIIISKERRLNILKNLKDEHFQNLKISPAIIEDLKKYRISNDRSPFKINNYHNNYKNYNFSSNDKLSEVLNENFSMKTSENNHHKNDAEKLNKDSSFQIPTKLNKTEPILQSFYQTANSKPCKKLERSKFLKERKIYSFVRLNENKEFFVECDQAKQNEKIFDRNGRDKAFFEYFGNHLNRGLAEAETKMKLILKKNLIRDSEEKLHQNKIDNKLFKTPNKIIKIKNSRKRINNKNIYKSISNQDKDRKTENNSSISQVNEFPSNQGHIGDFKEIEFINRNKNKKEDDHNYFSEEKEENVEPKIKINPDFIVHEEHLINKYLVDSHPNENYYKNQNGPVDINLQVLNKQSEIKQSTSFSPRFSNGFENSVQFELDIDDIANEDELDSKASYSYNSLNEEFEEYFPKDHKKIININNSNNLSIPFSKEISSKNVEREKSLIKNTEIKEEEKSDIIGENEQDKRINLREVNLRQNYLVKPNANNLPFMKENVIYSHDQLQIITSLKNIEFKVQNIPKMIDILSIIRRKKKLKTYDLPEIADTINFINNYISVENNAVPASYIVNFLYSLSEMQNFDEDRPSLKNDLMVYEILDKLIPTLNTLDNRSISNLLFSLQKYQVKNPKVFNFTSFLDSIEEIIVKKFTSEKFSNICMTQTIVAYSKCQAGSEEFYRIFADLVYNKKNIFKPTEVSIILYSYSNNLNCNDKLLIMLESEVIEKIHKFNGVELCNLARAYDRKKILSEGLKRKLIDIFIEKHENIKVFDLSYLYKILASENEKKFLKYSHSLINALSHDIDALSLVNLMSKAELMNKVDKNIYSLLKKVTIKLIDKKAIKGHELRKIYEYVKDVPFDGKYNTFVENITRHLEKIKYY